MKGRGRRENKRERGTPTFSYPNVRAQEKQHISQKMYSQPSARQKERGREVK